LYLNFDGVHLIEDKLHLVDLLSPPGLDRLERRAVV
jgi:hypothetical protein